MWLGWVGSGWIFAMVKITPGVTLKSYTFSKTLGLSRSNKNNNNNKTLINANILIDLI